MTPAELLRQLARSPLLDPAPAAVERLEKSIADALKARQMRSALRLMRFRRQVGEVVIDSAADRAQLGRLESLIEQTIALGQR